MISVAAGQHVSYNLPHSGAATIRITAVSPGHISYVGTDGVHEMVEAGRYVSLADQTRTWRPATRKEAAAFEARYRPAPDNWH